MMHTATFAPPQHAPLSAPSATRIILHHREHGLAALKAAENLGLTPTLQTPPQGVLTLGTGYLAALEASLRRDFPAFAFHFVVDCADAAGYALAALRAGCQFLLFQGDEVVRGKLHDIADRQGAVVLPPARATLDLWLETDPYQAALRWLSEQQRAHTKDLD